MRHPPRRRTAEFGKFESFVGGRRGCDRGRFKIALATAIMARVIIARMNIAGVVIAAVIIAAVVVAAVVVACMVIGREGTARKDLQ
jgi:hypothetical protein